MGVLMSDNTLGLAETLRALRAELGQAAQDAKLETVKFEIREVDVELSGVIKSEAGGKVEFRVLGLGAGLGASGKRSDAQTHTIKLKLTPHLFGDSRPRGMFIMSNIGGWDDGIYGAPAGGSVGEL
jgi:hypothetical protein